MGLYPINCPSCNAAHMWFSGNMDQRCSECKKPREFSIKMKNDGTSEGWIYPMDPIAATISGCQVIEKSAYDFQCKQVADMAKTFNDTVDHYQGMIRDLQTQVSIEKGEVARLMAMAKRRNKR